MEHIFLAKAIKVKTIMLLKEGWWLSGYNKKDPACT